MFLQERWFVCEDVYFLS